MEKKTAKIIGAICGGVLAAAIAPYRIKIDKENRSFEIDALLWSLKKKAGEEKDDYKASCLNVRFGVRRIRHEFDIHPIPGEEDPEVIGAIYHIEDGRVEFLPEGGTGKTREVAGLIRKRRKA